MGGLAVPLLGVGLGPRESAVVNGWAVHDAAVVVGCGLASITVVVVGGVDWGCDTVASAFRARTARGIVCQPGPSAVFGSSAESRLDSAVVIRAGRAGVAEFVERRVVASELLEITLMVDKFGELLLELR